MQEAINQFRASILRVRNLGSIVNTLESQTTQALDLSDVLRAELVFAVSALDQFIHEFVRLGMIEAYQGSRDRTQNFLRFQVSLESTLDGFAEGGGTTWLNGQIMARNGYRTFQTPDNIADAIRLISDVQLWNQIATHMDLPVQDVRNRLRGIVDRRNQITHEADINPSPYEERWPIDRQMAADAVDFIEQVVEAIYASVA